MANFSPIGRVPFELAELRHVSWDYHFPLVGLTKYSRGRITVDDHRGLFRGWRKRGIDGSFEQEITWGDDLIGISHGGFDIELYDSFFYGDEDSQSDAFPSRVITRHSLLHLAPTGNLVHNFGCMPELQRRKDELVNIIFNLMSIFEHSMVRWYYEGENTIRGDGLSKEVRTYRWIPEIRTSMWPRPSDHHQKELRELLPTLIDHYYQLSTSLRTQFREVARCFELACYAPSADVSFLYWHSCLDILNKIFLTGQIASGKNKISFSKALILACEKTGVNIEYADLFPEPTREEIFRKKNQKVFRMTEIRNKFLHDGFVIDDYNELIDLRSRMCGLVERMVLKLLGVDYRQTPLGKANYYE